MKRSWNTCEQTGWNTFDTLLKHRLNTGDILVKRWWNIHEDFAPIAWKQKQGDEHTDKQTEWHRHFLSCSLQLEVLNPEKLWVRKNFGLRKNLGKKFGLEKKFGSQKFGTPKKFGPIKYRAQNIGSQKTLAHKNFGSRKDLDSEKIWVHKNFDHKKIWVLKFKFSWV